ncbi:MAG: PH domain-containing protein [Candidatus Parvarchaeota archaeon]|nr:PH domain-containing protein [Candidatus Jingweiarchaeum tengchongense]
MIREEYLLPQEKILLEKSQTILVFKELWFSVILLFLTFFGYFFINFYFSFITSFLLILFCLMALFKRKLINYYVTNQRVIIEKGIFKKEVEWIQFSKIENVEIKKGFLGAVFDFGDIRLRASSQVESELIIKNVRDPERFQRLILTLLTGLKVAK